MRILITTPVYPPDLGGPAVYVPSLARWLVDRGHAVHVVAFGSREIASAHSGFDVTLIPRGHVVLRYARAFWRVLREAGRADVVYVNEHLAFLHVLAARLRGVPVVLRVMVDGAWEIAHRRDWCRGDGIEAFQGKRYGLRVALARFLQRRQWAACRRIIACSDFLAHLVVKHHGLDEAKVVRIHNAYHGPESASLPPTPAATREQLGLAVDGRYLLTVCRLGGQKRVDLLLRAMLGVPQDVELLIAGDGVARRSWETLAHDLGLAQRVRFLGSVPSAEIPVLMRAAEVFVLATEYEGLSHALIEALTVGVPIVSSAVCGNPEVVEDEKSGRLVDPLTAETLQRAITSLLQDAELRGRFSAEGRVRATRFTRERTFPQVEATLMDAAKAGSEQRT